MEHDMRKALLQDAALHEELGSKYAEESHRWNNPVADAISSCSEAHYQLARALTAQARKDRQKGEPG